MKTKKMMKRRKQERMRVVSQIIMQMHPIQTIIMIQLNDFINQKNKNNLENLRKILFNL